MRQRKPVPQQAQPEEVEEPFEKAKPSRPAKSTKSKVSADEDAYSPWLDVVRVASFLFAVFCISSYVISGGESWFWGMKDKPDYVKPSYWKEKIQGPVRVSFHALDLYH